MRTRKEPSHRGRRTCKEGTTGHIMGTMITYHQEIPNLTHACTQEHATHISHTHTHTHARLHTLCASLQAIRDSEWEFNEIMRTRTNQEQNIMLETPYYDVVRIKVRARP